VNKTEDHAARTPTTANSTMAADTINKRGTGKASDMLRETKDAFMTMAEKFRWPGSSSLVIAVEKENWEDTDVDHPRYSPEDAARLLKVPVSFIHSVIIAGWLAALQAEGDVLIRHDALVHLANRMLPEALKYLGTDFNPQEAYPDLTGSAEIDKIRHREAGRTVAFYHFRFSPTWIIGVIGRIDGRSTRALRTSGGSLRTTTAKQKAQDYCVCLIAGLVAESKFSGAPLNTLRETGGRLAYLKVKNYVKLLTSNGSESDAYTRACYLLDLETRAIALINDPRVWAGVESVCRELEKSGGKLVQPELNTVIQRGLGLQGGWDHI
jgi:hypothetical protein